MRVLCTSDFINPEVSDLVGETDQHIAWTPNLRDHVTLMPTRERSFGSLKLHTAPLKEGPVRRLRDALTPLLPAVDRALPKPAIDAIQVVVHSIEVSDIFGDPGTSKGLRVYCTAKVIAEVGKAVVDVLTPFIPALKRLEPLSFAVTVLFKCGDKIYAPDLDRLQAFK